MHFLTPPKLYDLESSFLDVLHTKPICFDDTKLFPLRRTLLYIRKADYFDVISALVPKFSDHTLNVLSFDKITITTNSPKKTFSSPQKHSLSQFSGSWISSLHAFLTQGRLFFCFFVLFKDYFLRKIHQKVFYRYICSKRTIQHKLSVLVFMPIAWKIPC